MNPEEYQRLANVDHEHWFYRGKRHIVKYWIDHYIKLTRESLLIDAGTGTGIWPLSMGKLCQVLGIDGSEESLRLARPRLESVGGKVMQSGLQRVDLPDRVATVITLLDVLEHLEKPEEAFLEMLRLTKPGGLIVVTVPALPCLWSDWDVALHHYRRYTKKTLLSTLCHPGGEMLHCAYFNTLMLPAVAVIRGYRRLRPAPVGGKRMEDEIPNKFINETLFRLMTWPACHRWVPAPLGVSLLAVVRRTSRI